MKNHVSIFVLFIVLFSITCSQAFSIEISLRAGGSKLLYDKRYYNELFAQKSPLIPSINLKLGWQDYSKSRYAELCHHPEFGIVVGADLVGIAKPADGSLGVGNLYSLYGYFDRPWVRTKGWDFGYSAGWGLGFCFNRLFNNITNPSNEMISSPVMWHASLGLQAHYAIHDKHVIGIGFYFNHYSNGALKFRNRGYNGFELALSYGINDLDGRRAAKSSVLTDTTTTINEQYVLPRDTSLQTKRQKPKWLAMYGDEYRRGFQFDVQVSGGVMSVEAVFDNTELRTGIGVNEYRFKCAVQTDCLYKYCRTQASGIGIDLFFTPFSNLIADNYQQYKAQQAANNGETYTRTYMNYKQATSADYKDPDKIIFFPVSVGISLRHEFSYRNLTTGVGVGFYLYHNDGIAQNKISYQLVSLKYHFPKLGDTYAGIVLKAHKFMAAECVQFCIGKRF